MMRVTTLKAGKHGPAGMIAYYAGLAEHQQSREGIGRGPVEYYLDPNEPPGRWWGKGCAALGVSGDVRPEQLEALLGSRHPRSGAPLGRGFGLKSARGFDATFSAPKSVSLLWALSDDAFTRAEVLAAHDAAVTAALDWFQRHGSLTRRGTDGVHQVDARGVAVALFRQHTSRSVDPQLHTHALVMAKVQDDTGRWFSLDARFLKRQQRAISFVYAAALRAELSTRLGVSWGPVVEGHADVTEVSPRLVELFSKRHEQVQAELARRIERWVGRHDGAQPNARTIARLERQAGLYSRPRKGHAIEAEALRVEWCREARRAGLELPALTPQPGGRGLGSWNDEAVIATALERVAAAASTWLHADLAREIAAVLPAESVRSARDLVGVVDRLADRGRERSIELHPPAPARNRQRADGRPLTEHVTDRLLSSPAVLGQERRLLSWAASMAPRPEEVIAGNTCAAAIRAVIGPGRLVLVVGPAGAGKTRTLGNAVAILKGQGTPVIGLAPSGKAADVLATETGCDTTTLAKLLHEHAKPHGPAPGFRVPVGATVILDEAGMASTNDLDRLVGLAEDNGWRLVCVGDPEQLPAVGRGGMFAHWRERFGAQHLEEVQRFAEPWQAEASLALRRGEPAAASLYAKHHRLKMTHPALVASGVARLYDQMARGGDSVAITTGSVSAARAINAAIQRHQQQRRGPGDEPGVALADGTRVYAGDRIATRRNDPSLVTSERVGVRNRQVWTVRSVGADGSLVVADQRRGSVVLPARYVARHVELGWAVTGYGSQGVTVDHGICVIEPSSTRAGIYVGMTRGRGHNMAIVVDASGLEEPKEAFAAAIARPPNALTAHAAREQLYRAHGHAIADELTPQPPRPRLDRGGHGHDTPSLSL